MQKKITAAVIFAIAGFCAGLIGASQAHALTVYEQEEDNGTFSTVNGSYCFQGPNDSCLGSFVLSETTQFTKDVSRLFLKGIRVTAGATDTCFNISNITVTDSIAFCGNMVGTSFTEIDALMTTTDSPVNLPAGTYYIWANQTVTYDFLGESSRDITGWVTTDGSTPTPPTTASTTLITITPSGTIASSSPLTITITGTLGTDDLASTTAAGNTVRLLSWVGGVDTSFISPNSTWTLTEDGSFSRSYQVTTNLPAGNFKIYASITSAGTYDCSAIDSGGVCVPIGGINVASTTYFTLNTSYFEHITGTSTPTNLYTPAPCGISDLSGCFQNALAALFYPSVSPGAAFENISQTARGKAPFVYVYQMSDIRNSLFTSSSTAPTSVEVPLWKLPGAVATSSLVMISSTLIANVPYANTVKLIITAILWLLMAEYVYYRVLRMHDTTTPT